MNKRNNYSTRQIDSRFTKYIVLRILLEEGIINQPTFENVVSHNYKEYKGKIF